MTIGPTLLPFSGKVNNITFDPASLVLTSWIRGPFTGAIPPPWPHTPSAGTSGNVEENFRNLTPTNGPSLNSIISARYDSTVLNQYQTTAMTHRDGSSLDDSEILTASQYTIAGLIKVNTAPAAQTPAYKNGTIIQGDARWGVAITSTGLGVYHFDGAVFPYVEVPMTGGVWHFFCVRFGGVIGSAMVQIDIDSTAGTPTSLANIGVVGGVTVSTGPNTFDANIAFYSFDIMDRLTLKTAISDTIRDKYRDGYLNKRYNLNL